MHVQVKDIPSKISYAAGTIHLFSGFAFDCFRHHVVGVIWLQKHQGSFSSSQNATAHHPHQ